jgi:hypothetical protein
MKGINIGKIDKENAILYDVVIIEEGEAKGHDQWIDSDFIKDVVKQGQETGEIGLKCRFNHPNLCAGALGTYVGRLKNFRLALSENLSTKCVADLHIDDVCKISPNGNLYDYIINIAETSPDMLGMSIAFKEDEMACGTKKKKFEDDSEIDIPTLSKLYACDLVDDPAATEQLFDKTSFAAKVTEFLDTNPQIYELAVNNPELIEKFLTKYNNYKSKREPMSEKSLLQKFREMFASNEDVEQFAAEHSKEIKEMQEQINLLNSSFSAIETEKNELLQKIASLEAEKAEFEAKQEAVAALEAELNEIKSTWKSPEEVNQFKSQNEPEDKKDKLKNFAKERIEEIKNKSKK